MKIISLKNIQVEGVSHDPKIKKQVMIRSKLIPKLTNFSQAVFKAGQKTTQHKHEKKYEVYLVTAGEAKLRVNRKEYRIDKNSCFIIEPKELHSIENDSGRDLVMVYFGITAD